MQMTDSDFTLNDWRRRLGGGGAGHYSKDENVLLSRADMPAELRAFLLLLFCMQSGQAFVRGEQFPSVRLAMDSSIYRINRGVHRLARSVAGRQSPHRCTKCNSLYPSTASVPTLYYSM